MNRLKMKLPALVLGSLSLAGCGGAGESNGIPAAPVEPTVAASDEPASKPMVEPIAVDGASPGKPLAPISIDYDILSNPIVGMPVQINVEVSSAHGPVDVRYTITDRSALMFQEGQVERLEVRDPSKRTPRQVAVIPLREGRLYVNVSAEIDTADGPMIRSMSIPIKVGAAPEEATIEGEVVEGPDGEAVISLPAKETN